METNKSGMYEMDIMMNRCAKLRSDFLFGKTGKMDSFLQFLYKFCYMFYRYVL